MYIDNRGIEHEDYEAACRYYGADSPKQLAAEAEAEYEDWMDHCSEHDLFDFCVITFPTASSPATYTETSQDDIPF